MSRSKLVFPNHQPLFSTQIAIRITDINYGNHLGNDKVLSIIHEARVQLLRANNMSELNAGGVSLILGEALIIYKNEGFYGDILTIDIWANDIGNASFDLLYKLTTPRADQVVTVAQAKTTMICFDYTNRKTQLITDHLRSILDQGNSGI